MRKKYAGPDGRAALVARLLKERPICEAGARIGAVLPRPKRRRIELGTVGRLRDCALWVWIRCSRNAEHVHEVLARSAGGDILDEKNCLCVCFNCHVWIGNNPKLAREAGLRASRYNR